jgi:hypothetical protein
VKSKHVYFVRLGLLLAFIALAGCMQAVKNEDSSVIRARAIERWNFLIAHQADKAYDYLSPGYRETKTRDAYAKEMNDRPVHWSKVTFGSQECDADVCKVRLSVDYKVNLGGPVGSVASLGLIVETWVKTKGKWYFLPEQLQPARLGKET